MNHPDPYAFGHQTVETAKLQRALANPDLKFYTGPLDGIYGRDTKAAVEAAQAHFSLVATGTPDKALLAFLGLAIAPAEPRSNPLTDFLTGLAIKAALNQLKGLPAMAFLTGYKTYIIGILMILTGAAAVIGITMPGGAAIDPAQGIQLVLNGLGLIFLRGGVAKIGG